MSNDTALSMHDGSGGADTIQTSTNLPDFILNLPPPVSKLDADHYMAEDLHGATESLFGSGNMNFLLLQSGQTNDALNAARIGAVQNHGMTLANNVAPGGALGNLAFFNSGKNFLDVNISHGADESHDHATAINAGSLIANGAPLQHFAIIKGFSGEQPSGGGVENAGGIRALASLAGSPGHDGVITSAVNGVAGAIGNTGNNGSSGNNGANGSNGSNQGGVDILHIVLNTVDHTVNTVLNTVTTTVADTTSHILAPLPGVITATIGDVTTIVGHVENLLNHAPCDVLELINQTIGDVAQTTGIVGSVLTATTGAVTNDVAPLIDHGVNTVATTVTDVIIPVLAPLSGAITATICDVAPVVGSVENLLTHAPCEIPTLVDQTISDVAQATEVVTGALSSMVGAVSGDAVPLIDVTLDTNLAAANLIPTINTAIPIDLTGTAALGTSVDAGLAATVNAGLSVMEQTPLAAHAGLDLGVAAAPGDLANLHLDVGATAAVAENVAAIISPVITMVPSVNLNLTTSAADLSAPGTDHLLSVTIDTPPLAAVTATIDSAPTSASSPLISINAGTADNIHLAITTPVIDTAVTLAAPAHLDTANITGAASTLATATTQSLSALSGTLASAVSGASATVDTHVSTAIDLLSVTTAAATNTSVTLHAATGTTLDTMAWPEAASVDTQSHANTSVDATAAHLPDPVASVSTGLGALLTDHHTVNSSHHTGLFG